MKLQNKNDALRAFNQIVYEIRYIPEIQDKISSQGDDEYITLMSHRNPYQDRFVMVAFDDETQKLQIHVWERIWKMSLGKHHSETIFRSEIDLTADFLSIDILHFAIKPVLDNWLNN